MSLSAAYQPSRYPCHEGIHILKGIFYVTVLTSSTKFLNKGDKEVTQLDFHTRPAILE